MIWLWLLLICIASPICTKLLLRHYRKALAEDPHRADGLKFDFMATTVATHIGIVVFTGMLVLNPKIIGVMLLTIGVIVGVLYGIDRILNKLWSDKVL